VEAASTATPDCQERADCAERMLDMTSKHDQQMMWQVLDKVGQAAEARGEQMVKYVHEAKDFYKEMKDLA
jgi:hypothetical protein